MSKGPTVEECDLVMKGGITSGIVYPPLISVLKDKYRFRSIGGTSAGAIAAAGAAAAEYGREANGFAKLDHLTHELSEGTFLLNLFQPSKRTRPLFNILLNSTQIKKSKRSLFMVRLLSSLTWSLLKEVTVAFLIGALLGVGLTFLFAWLVGGSVQGRGISVAIFFGWLGAIVVGMIKLALILLKDVPRNFLGMCIGRRDDVAKEDSTVLTDWLNDRFDDMAGIKDHPTRHKSGYKPLTFHDLENKKFGDKRDEVANGQREANITLRMVTSNLSQNQPYILPFRDNIFIFNKDEFSRFFPKRVIDYLIDPNTPRTTAYVLPNNYYFLPEADALPVIVATRLSLSFPILLSAVPLYTIT